MNNPDQFKLVGSITQAKSGKSLCIRLGKGIVGFVAITEIKKCIDHPDEIALIKMPSDLGTMIKLQDSDCQAVQPIGFIEEHR